VAKQPRREGSALDKVQDAELRGRIERGEGDPVSVILEVDLPAQQVKAQSREDRLRGNPSMWRGVIEESPAVRHDNAERVAKARADLEKVLGTAPRWLAAARAFTLKGTPAQLRQIADMEFIRAVRPNRKLSR
jgi:hypothetical protein